MESAPKKLTLTVGPFIGMNDSPNLAAQDAKRASLITNMYNPAAAVGGDLISRPGYTRIALGAAIARTGTFTSSGNVLTGTSTLFTTELAVGDIVTTSASSGIITSIASDTSAGCVIADDATPRTYTYTPAGITTGPIHGCWLYRNTDGTVKRFLLVTTASTLINGAGAGRFRFLDGAVRIRLVEYDPSNSTHPLTDRTSTSMNAVALDKDIRIYATTFANYFILSDGTNRLRKITSAYVLSNLTDGNYAAQGAPWVYYGKLFIVDASDAITLRWSEENDPDTGYGTGTSDNSWSLRQTSADQLTGGIGSNEAIYCGRQNSIAVITGAAASDFRSSGTVDAIQNIGTASPDAMALVNSSMVFLDQYGRPGRIEPGYGYIPLWKRIQEQLRGLGLTAALLRAAWCRYDPTTNLVKFGYRASNAATTNDQMLVFDADSWECLGLHEVYRTSAYAVADHAYATVFPDENNVSRFVVASGTTTDPAFYVQQTEITPSASALEVTSGGSVTVSVTVRTPKVGGDPLLEKTFQRVTVGTRNVGGTTAGVTLWQGQYIGPYDTALTAAVALRIGNSATVPTSATFAGACLKAELQGINGKGRYLQVTLTNNTAGAPATRATLDTVTVQAMPEDADMARR